MVNPANQNILIFVVVSIALPKIINPKREAITVGFDPNLSSIHPKIKAPQPENSETIGNCECLHQQNSIFQSKLTIVNTFFGK